MRVDHTLARRPACLGEEKSRPEGRRLNDKPKFPEKANSDTAGL